MELVTGGAGFIGSHLVDSLVAKGKRVRVLDNFSSGREEFLSHHAGSGRVEVMRGDLLDLESVRSAMKGVDTVHHMAANPDIRLGTSVTDTDLRQGTIATYNVLESMRMEGVNRISFSSSSAVYGEASQMPTPETYGPIKPISLYGASKLASEALITAWCGTFGAKSWIHRFANIVGPRGTHGVIYDFIHKLKSDPSRLEVLGDGQQEKSYMSAHDCVKSMLHIIEMDEGGSVLYNLGTGDKAAWADYDNDGFLDLIGADLRYIVHGSETYDLFAPMLSGDTVTIRHRIDGFELKKGGALDLARVTSRIGHPERGLLTSVSRIYIHVRPEGAA